MGTQRISSNVTKQGVAATLVIYSLARVSQTYYVDRIQVEDLNAPFWSNVVLCIWLLP